jgi:3'-phosphoadenosine 5'-phosphosulfate sulfotransferase (PAPS reductase)/FAD synthetase
MTHREALIQRQSLPLEAKVQMSLKRIREWYEYWDGDVYVSFSGGKDSTVLLHMVGSIYPEVPAMFLDTGLEYPEIREFVRSIEGVTWVRPKIPFTEVIKKYGYPIITKEVSQKLHEIRTTHSDTLRQKRLYGDVNGNGIMAKKWRFLIEAPFLISHRCCDALKKSPARRYESETRRKAYTGQLVGESTLRSSNYLRNGCNMFDSPRPMSAPMSFWLEEDVWEYLRTRKVPYCSIYDTGVDRTGCMFCMFGVHLEKGLNRFQRMQKTHPKQWEYCIHKLGLKKPLDAIGVAYEHPDLKKQRLIQVLHQIQTDASNFPVK